MDHKIVATEKEEVLVYRAETYDDDKSEYSQTVTVQAWLKDPHIEDGEPVYKFEEVDFKLEEQARAFIRDFSISSAKEFLIRNAL